MTIAIISLIISIIALICSISHLFGQIHIAKKRTMNIVDKVFYDALTNALNEAIKECCVKDGKQTDDKIN